MVQSRLNSSRVRESLERINYRVLVVSVAFSEGCSRVRPVLLSVQSAELSSLSTDRVRIGEVAVFQAHQKPLFLAHILSLRRQLPKSLLSASKRPFSEGSHIFKTLSPAHFCQCCNPIYIYIYLWYYRKEQRPTRARSILLSCQSSSTPGDLRYPRLCKGVVAPVIRVFHKSFPFRFRKRLRQLVALQLYRIRGSRRVSPLIEQQAEANSNRHPE